MMGKRLTEGSVKKGGSNPAPKRPRPDYKPPRYYSPSKGTSKKEKSAN
ncbi:hypothetical protein ABID56_002578 [Alkalibacillus flavidus]|uniref:Uncharacterized protein n=1 Tax=Alkalibacillus flavidus TaxID=546021 RepID=A0ABV2KXX5_9BACI